MYLRVRMGYKCKKCGMLYPMRSRNLFKYCLKCGATLVKDRYSTWPSPSFLDVEVTHTLLSENAEEVKIGCKFPGFWKEIEE